MPRADENEIVELRFTPVCPVDDVLAVEVAALGTTRILTAAIARPQRPSYGGWYDPRLAPHVQHLTLTIGKYRHQCTGESPHGLGMQTRTPFDGSYARIRKRFS